MNRLAALALALSVFVPTIAGTELSWQGDDVLRWAVERVADGGRLLHVAYGSGSTESVNIVYHYDEQGRLLGKTFKKQDVFPQSWTGRFIAVPAPNPRDADEREAALVFDNLVPLAVERLVPRARQSEGVLQRIRAYFADAADPTAANERDHFLLLRKAAGLVHYRNAFMEEQFSTGVPVLREQVHPAAVGERYSRLDAAFVKELGLPVALSDLSADLPRAISQLEKHLEQQITAYLALQDRGALLFAMPLIEEPAAKARIERLFHRLAQLSPRLSRLMSDLLAGGHFHLIAGGEDVAFGSCSMDFTGDQPHPIFLSLPFVSLPEAEIEENIRQQFVEAVSPSDARVARFLEGSGIPYSLFILAHEAGHYWGERGFRASERKEAWQQRVRQLMTKMLFRDMYLATRIPEGYVLRADADPELVEFGRDWSHRVIGSRSRMHVLIDDETKALFDHLNRPPREGLVNDWINETASDGPRSWVPASEMLAHAYAIDQLAGFFFAGEMDR